VKVIGFAGYSGSGKTTLVERLIPELKARGLRVSVVKHAHHKFEIDRPGKDSWRHREAGAFEVVVASDQRLALIREFEARKELSVHHLIAELSDGVDWVLVEGYKSSDLHKIEIWRGAEAGPPGYPDDVFVVAIATNAPSTLPEPTLRPVLNLDDPRAVAQWLVDHGHRFEYDPHLYLRDDA
jgi:molybdopterin-guanine dinucleotide biosynthesis protein B